MSDQKENLITLAGGQQASEELPLTREMVERMNTATERRIFIQLQRGEPLTAEIAIQAWIERYTHHILLRRLTQQVRMGQTAGEDLTPDMQKD